MIDNDKLAMKLAQDTKNLKNSMPALIDLTRMQAKVTRVRYLALIAEGFTEDEALKLCQSAPF